MNATVLSSASHLAWLAQPRVLLALTVFALGFVDKAIVFADWLAVPSAVTAVNHRSGRNSPPLFLPLVAVPALLALGEL